MANTKKMTTEQTLQLHMIEQWFEINLERMRNEIRCWRNMRTMQSVWCLPPLRRSDFRFSWLKNEVDETLQINFQPIKVSYSFMAYLVDQARKIGCSPETVSLTTPKHMLFMGCELTAVDNAPFVWHTEP